jgi:hypothetical protein
VDVIVWMDDWQQACCGDRFEVGSAVTWEVRPQEQSEWLRTVVGADEAKTIAYRAERHDDVELRRLTGSVRSIRSVRCRHEMIPGEGMYPIAGSAVFEPLVAVDRGGPVEDGFDRLGYLVELDSSGGSCV